MSRLRQVERAPDWRAACWIDAGEAADARASAIPARDVLLRFRRTFRADELDAACVHVSADSRYALWLNGELVGRGPARWSVRHRVFDTYDVSDLVRRDGPNAFAAEVLRWGDSGPHFDVSARPAFLLQAGELCSDASFRARAVSSFNRDGPPEFPRIVHVAGNWLEERDLRDDEPGWREPDFDDAATCFDEAVKWSAARELVRASSPAAPWRLHPRAIPALLLREPEELRAVQRGFVQPAAPTPPFGYATIALPEGALDDGGLPDGVAPVGATATVSQPPVRMCGDERVHYLVFDAGRLVTARLALELEASAGARVELMYAESPSVNGVKGRRDVLDGQRVEGYADRFVARDGVQRFEPFEPRTFRYVRVAARSTAPLVLRSLRARRTGYAFDEQGSFACSDPVLERVWRAGWETCRLCAHETYVDSPYYEQLQYVADARIQALVGYVVAAERRLPEAALRQLAETRGATGFLPARYPCRYESVIPTYSFLWIEMLEEHHLHTGCEAFAREMLPVVGELLELARAHADDEGCLRDLPGWSFLDWSFPDRGTLHTPEDVSAPASLFFLGGLQAATRLCARLGETELSRGFDARARALAGTLARKLWSPSQASFHDGVVRRSTTVHTNALALLYGLAPEGRARELALRIASGAGFRWRTHYFDFYVHRALVRAGRTDLVIANARRWDSMLALGATTWFETNDESRCDCHAWSATPTYDLPTTVLGVRVVEPGYARVAIEPVTAGLEWARGRVATPRGPIEVAWQDAGRELEVELPQGVRGTVVLPSGQGYELCAGRQRFV